MSETRSSPMGPPMPPPDLPRPHLSIDPCGNTQVFDEVFDQRGRPRASWQDLVAGAKRLTAAELTARSQQADRLLMENGGNFNVFQDANQLQRPWRLDLVPMAFDANEWRELEAGLRQRAKLFDAVVRDCYGPRHLIADGSLPPEVLFANPGFLRSFCNLHSGSGPFISFYAAELARDPSGQWRVMADRADAPTGMAFALENRIIVSRTIPSALNIEPVRRLAPFFLQVQETMRRLGSRQTENPRIVILSPGSHSPYYFEDVYLARYLGYSLVEGGDLGVRDDRVFLKTLAGLIPIDVVISRGSERGVDPLELGGSAAHGVPGLLHAMRKGQVSMANSPGSGLAESPIFMAFLSKLCRRCLGEDLLLPSIPTWWCGNPEHLSHVRAHFTSLVVKPAFEASGGAEIIVGRLSRDEQDRLWGQIAAKPQQFVAQELICRSAVPVFRDDQIGVGHAALRVFLVADSEGYTVMPGGLVRVAPTTDPMELSILAGEMSKDLWVMADGPVKRVTLLSPPGQPVQLRRTSAIFPSRVADDLFWLGQSIDRADFLARLLRSTIERLMMEQSDEVSELPALVRALADQGQVEPGYAIELMAERLPAFAKQLPRMVADATEVRGLAATISELHRLSALERLWISPDNWRKIHETTSAFQAAAGTPWTSLFDLLNSINQLILDLAAVSGLIQDGMVRSPAWRLLDIGRRIERTRNMAHLLRAVILGESESNRAVLKVLLEVIDCRMTYRSRYLDDLQVNAVLDLFITDETCPRSIAAQLMALADHVDSLPAEAVTPLRTEEKRLVMAALHAVRMLPPEQLETAESHQVRKLITDLETQLKAFSDLITRKYLLHSGVPRQFASDLEIPQ